MTVMWQSCEYILVSGELLQLVLYHWGLLHAAMQCVCVSCVCLWANTPNLQPLLLAAKQKCSPSSNTVGSVMEARGERELDWHCTADSIRVQNKKFEMVDHFSNSSWIWLAMCTKWMHHAEILIGHFRETIGNWPVASCYFALWVW